MVRHAGHSSPDLRVVRLEDAGQAGLTILLSHLWGIWGRGRGLRERLHALLLSQQRLVLWIQAGLHR